jgi:hypothetical protein
MTSHSCQSETVNRAIFHATARDGESRELVNKRLAYTAWSRARNEVEVYTNDVGMLAKKLSREVSKEVALEGRAAELGAKLGLSSHGSSRRRWPSNMEWQWRCKADDQRTARSNS